MQYNELTQKINKLDNKEKITFLVNGQKVDNRFDHENIDQYKEADIENLLSYSLYSYIASAIIYKAQGNDMAKKGYSHFDRQWETIIQNQEKDIFDNSKVVKDNAMRLLDSFLMSGEDIRLDALMARFSPLCVLRLIQLNPQQSRKIMKTFTKRKEVIFNQTTLFIRSLYHSLLNQSGIDPMKIHPDHENLANGLFSYDGTTLYIPTWQNAFSMNGYKNVITEALKELSPNFPLSEIKDISVIYLVKDIIANAIIE
jgi:hypothetical protein